MRLQQSCKRHVNGKSLQVGTAAGQDVGSQDAERRQTSAGVEGAMRAAVPAPGWLQRECCEASHSPGPCMGSSPRGPPPLPRHWRAMQCGAPAAPRNWRRPPSPGESSALAHVFVTVGANQFAVLSRHPSGQSWARPGLCHWREELGNVWASKLLLENAAFPQTHIVG